ncbi:thiamine pyrophosphate-binding protein [Thermoanaerobacterium sp. DL9XJH110]|uniref:thiamine pyrophosphate-binding protein n=1 Tax=Thermoanaerobacterium sp. DL9XJH110 TaxID=3386643 RepID=UPI003BB4D768
MKELVSYQLVDYLERRGVKYIFGLCGHTVIAMLDALKDSKIQFVSVRHEQIAAHAADGYSRASKTPAVLMVHLGPGLTNATTGVANASLDSIPMVVIAGDVPSYYYGKHPHQEVNMHLDAGQFEIYRPFVKRAWRIDRPEMLPEVLDKAFTLAVSGRPGPVLISVPMDIFSAEISTEYFERTKVNTPKINKPSLDPDIAEDIVKLLLNAERPMIYAGGGIITADASSELEEFAEFLDIPVIYTLMGKGAISDAHPLTVGMTGFWGTAFTNEMSRNADVILGLGTRFSEADCSSWYRDVTFNIPPTKLIHIDIDPQEIGRNYPVEIGAVADVKAALKVLLAVAKDLKPEGISRPELRQAIAENRKKFNMENEKYVKSDSFPLRPERILAEVREVLPEDGIIVTDVGWNKNGVGQQFPIYKAGTILTPGGLCTMGFGPAAALGAKLAQPDKKIMALIGDGAFSSQPSVMATAVEMNIPVVWVVMNNYAFGTIAGLEYSHYKTTYGTKFMKEGKPYNPDFAAVAMAYGVKGKKITKASEFKEALKEALDSDEPYLIDVPMLNEPVPTSGCWNINDIYKPRKKA